MRLFQPSGDARTTEGPVVADEDPAQGQSLGPRAWAASQLRRQTSRDGRGIADQLHQLSSAASTGLECDGAAVTLKSIDGSEAVAAATDDTSRDRAQLEFGVGEGPAHDAFAHGRPVLAAELGGAHVGAWPGYAPAAQAAGIGAVFAFPLHLGASRFGVLSIFSHLPRQLHRVEVSRSLALSELATEMLLASSASTRDGEIDPDLKSALAFRSEIYQAQGMVMVALGVGLPEALALMRAYSFSNGRILIDVSLDIVEGRLHLTDDRPDK